MLVITVSTARGSCSAAGERLGRAPAILRITHVRGSWSTAIPVENPSRLAVAAILAGVVDLDARDDAKKPARAHTKVDILAWSARALALLYAVGFEVL